MIHFTEINKSLSREMATSFQQFYKDNVYLFSIYLSAFFNFKIIIYLILIIIYQFQLDASNKFIRYIYFRRF